VVRDRSAFQGFLGNSVLADDCESDFALRRFSFAVGFAAWCDRDCHLTKLGQCVYK
jgi:hypothetical protein